MQSNFLKADLYGESIQRMNVSAFTLTERFYPPFFQTPEHAHENALFCLVLGGNYTETYGKQKRECSKYTTLFHACDDPHAEHFHGHGGHSFIVEIENDWMISIRERVSFPNISADFSGGNLAQLGLKLYQEFQTTDVHSPLIVEGLMLEIVGETGRQSSVKFTCHPPLWLKKAESYLLERFAEPCSLQEIADHVRTHPVHLAKTFRKFRQTTVGNYLRRIRLENARTQLIKTKKPLAEIALENGFSDQSHFTRLFKNEFGITPNNFRKKSSKS